MCLAARRHMELLTEFPTAEFPGFRCLSAIHLCKLFALHKHYLELRCASKDAAHTQPTSAD